MKLHFYSRAEKKHMTFIEGNNPWNISVSSLQPSFQPSVSVSVSTSPVVEAGGHTGAGPLNHQVGAVDHSGSHPALM